MNVIYIQDQEIAIYEGAYYHSKSGHFFERYLSGLNDSDKLIVYTGAKIIKDAKIVEKYNCVNHKRIEYRIIPEFRKLKNIPAICRLMRLAVSKADFCYLRCGVAASFAGYFCQKHHVPYMSIVNEDVYRSGINHSNITVRLSAFPLGWASRYVVKNADYSCYVTQVYLQKQYPCKGEMLGCSDVEFLNIHPDSLKRRTERINKMSEAVTLGSVGNVATVIKGQDTVVKALAALKNEGHANYIYQIVGAGNPASLLTLAYKLGVADQIEFLGQFNHEDVLKWFEAVDIYLHPSRSEGLPRTIIEAMTKATPCICSSVGGIPELINEEFLFSYDGNEVEQLKNLILKMNKEIMNAESKRNFESSKLYDPQQLEGKRSVFFAKAINDTKKKYSK